MGQNQSTEDPAAMTVSPGGTPHIVAPRSHPNTSSLNPSTSGPIQSPAPLLQPPSASRASPGAATSASANAASHGAAHHPPSPFDPSTNGPSHHPSSSSPYASSPNNPLPLPAQPPHLQSSPLSDLMPSPTHQPSPLGPSSLSQQVRDLIDADPSAALSALSGAAALTLAGSGNPANPSSSPPSSNSSSPSSTLLLPPLLPPAKVETVPSAFKWVHGGTEVFVTGSFNNWGGKFVMQRMDDNEFSLIIDLPPGTHAYKYVVDAEWKLDEDAPTVTMGGDVSNVVEVKRPVFEYPPANYADSDDDDADERKQRTAYAQVTPQVDDYVKEPIKLPPQLTTVILQHDMEGQLLPVPEHVVLNHLYVLPSTDTQLLITGCTQRFKPNSHTRITHKFVTTVYYQPKPTGEGEGVGGMGGGGSAGGPAMRGGVGGMTPYQAYTAYDASMNGSMG